MFLGPASRVRFCCYRYPKQETESPRALESPQETRGWTHCLFSFCILDLGTSLPRLRPRPNQPIIIFYVHCIKETNMFFIVLFLAAVFLAREKHSISFRVFLMTFQFFQDFHTRPFSIVQMPHSWKKVLNRSIG